MCCFEFIKQLNIQEKNECFSGATVAKEKGKEFRVEKNHTQSVCRVKVDNCLIKDDLVKKCDFLFYICETKKILLIELKGTDIEQAVKQIVETKSYFMQKLRNPDTDYKGFIVSSSIPRSAERRFRNIQEKTYKQHKIMIKKSHQRHIEKIN